MQPEDWKSVTVFHGVGTREITSPLAAKAFLDEWPRGRRGSIYETACRACHAALCRELSHASARSAFAGFARSAGILVPEIEPHIAAALPARPGGPLPG